MDKITIQNLEGEKLYNELIKNYNNFSIEEVNEYFLKLEGRFLYEAGKNISKLSNEVKRKGFKKLEGKYIVEAMKHWKGLTKEDKKENLYKLINDGKLYSQALKILQY